MAAERKAKADLKTFLAANEVNLAIKEAAKEQQRKARPFRHPLCAQGPPICCAGQFLRPVQSPGCWEHCGPVRCLTGHPVGSVPSPATGRVYRWTLV